MATLRDIKRRITGVKSTQQITKAMKMVAAAKLRRAQEAIINARPYARRITEMLSHLITEEDRVENPFLQTRDGNKIALVVVTSDRGLCGAFNTNIIREAAKFVEEQQLKNAEVHVFCAGKKGQDYFSRRDYKIAGRNPAAFSPLKYDTALNISKNMIDSYLNGTFDKVYIIYNEFKSIILQKIVIEQFLPIPETQGAEESKEKLPDYIFEPGQREIFQFLLPKHLKAQMWRIMLESNASEFGARMTAMDNATTNAKELIRTLQLKYNRERQAAITKEILEIVSGANALQTG
jgi:F-type H+-transporting ATPase subunit gamma